MKTISRLVSVVLVLSFSGLHALAQTSSATISGHVVDQSRGIVTSAEVTLLNQETNVTVTTHVLANGDFIFPDMQPGTFTVIVKAPGYKELRQVGLVLSASQNLSAGTLTLQIGTVAESVTVSAAITPLQTTSAERSAVLDNAQMENLLAIGRDAMALTRLNPGVVGGSGSSSLGTSTTPTVNGVNSQYNLATVDGVPGNTRGGATLDTPPNMDAIQEVTMLESSYSAANGKVSGANFNFVTKNGTNQFHGGVYYYFRNEDLNANAYFNKFNGATIARPRYRYNTFGGTLGGPIFWPGKFNSKRTKLFFFVSYENAPIRSPDGTKYFRIPTQLEVNGDFSQTYQTHQATNKPLYIRNPTAPGACAATTGGPGCFVGNKILPNMISGQGQILLQILYQNTIAAHPENYIANNPALTQNDYNYTTNYSSDKSYHQLIYRVDYNPTEKLHLYARISGATINNDGYASTTNKYTWLFPVNYQLTEPSYALNLTYTFSPTLVNEFNFGASAWNEYSRYDPANIAKVQLGASGFNLPSLYPGVNPMNLFPGATFAGVSGVSGDIPSYGWDSRFPFNDNVLNLSFNDGLTKIIRSHTLKFGGDVETDTYLQTNHNRVGTFAFDQNSNNPNDSNFAYGNAMLGNVYTYSQTTRLLSYDPRTTVLDFYAQDTWKVNQHLVLDYGMRTSYSLAQKLLEGNNFVPTLYNASKAPALYVPVSKTQAIDPSGNLVPAAYAGLLVPNTGDINNGILYVNTPGYPQGTTYNMGLFWQPRFGFAYSLNDKTVIRGHYGIFYNARSGSGQEGDLTNNAPSTNSPTQYYSSINSTASNYYAAGGVSNLSGPFSIGHALPLHMPLPYTEQVSLGFQRAIPFGGVVDVAYVGTFTRHASRYVPINTVPYGAEFKLSNQSAAGGPLPDNFYRPYPGFNGINMQQDDLTTNYNALQARITRRLHNGLEFGAVYTYSKTMDYGTCSTGSAVAGTSTGCSDSYNFSSAVYQNLRAWNYGPASYDIKHNLAINYLWALPNASRLWDNFATRAVLDGWQISGIMTYLSGVPAQVALSVTGNPNITGGGDGARIALTCDPMRNAPKTFNNWFNNSCLATPIAGAVGTASNPSGIQYSLPAGAVFSPKVNFFLPGNTNFDTALFKNMPLNEKGLKLQLRVETYNTFNHSQFNAVNATATFNSATTSGTLQTSNLGQFSGTANPRYMQLALRIDF
jgi:hypothetical protein